MVSFRYCHVFILFLSFIILLATAKVSLKRHHSRSNLLKKKHNKPSVLKKVIHNKQFKDEDYTDYDYEYDYDSIARNVIKRGQFPYIVGISHWYYHVCLGTLVAPNWVVSAAQCFNKKRNTKDLIIKAGIIDLLDESPKVQSRRVSRIIRHPKSYESEKCGIIVSDIVLLKTETSFEFNNITRPIRLPTSKRSIEGPGAVLGLSTNALVGQPLQYADVTILLHTECKNHIATELTNFKYHEESMMCAKLVKTTTELCTGNIGSPVIRNDVLVGQLSITSNSCKKDPTRTHIGFYTKMSRYVKFIKKHISPDTQNDTIYGGNHGKGSVSNDDAYDDF